MKWNQNLRHFRSTSFGDVFLDERKLDDITLLEKKRWWMVQVWKKELEKSLPFFDAVLKVGVAFAETEHGITRYTGRDSGISSEWPDKTETPINLDIGNAYYKSANRIQQIGMYMHKFNAAFDIALESWLMNHRPQKAGKILKLTINNRVYWYHSGYNRYSIIWWNEIVWPEDDVMEVSIE
jgi:hypothetical protein